MITNTIADAVIERAKTEMDKDRALPPISRSGMTPGCHVMTVFYAVTGHDLPYSRELSRCTNWQDCRAILLRDAQ